MLFQIVETTDAPQEFERTMKHALSTLSAAAVLALSSAPASALTVDNITYTLSQSFLSVTESTETWSMTLDIVNNSNDGRTGVTSFAFTRPDGYLSAALSGWTTYSGGLSSSGCNGVGNFFCFSGYAAAAPVMSFTFTVTADNSAFAFADYNPSFKIDWIGSQNNYDLVSLPINAVNPVPEPGTYAMMLAGLGAMGALLRRRRKS